MSYRPFYGNIISKIPLTVNSGATESDVLSCAQIPQSAGSRFIGAGCVQALQFPPGFGPTDVSFIVKDQSGLALLDSEVLATDLTITRVLTLPSCVEGFLSLQPHWLCVVDGLALKLSVAPTSQTTIYAILAPIFQGAT